MSTISIIYNIKIYAPHSKPTATQQQTLTRCCTCAKNIHPIFQTTHVFLVFDFRDFQEFIISNSNQQKFMNSQNRRFEVSKFQSVATSKFHFFKKKENSRSVGNLFHFQKKNSFSGNYSWKYGTVAIR